MIKLVVNGQTKQTDTFTVSSNEPITIQIHRHRNYLVAYVFRGLEVGEECVPLGGYDSASKNISWGSGKPES